MDPIRPRYRVNTLTLHLVGTQLSITALCCTVLHSAVAVIWWDFRVRLAYKCGRWGVSSLWHHIPACSKAHSKCLFRAAVIMWRTTNITIYLSSPLFLLPVPLHLLGQWLFQSDHWYLFPRILMFYIICPDPHSMLECRHRAGSVSRSSETAQGKITQDSPLWNA